MENRIAELEKKIYGLEKRSNIEDKVPENTILESLSHANTLISSALSGREKLNALIQKLPELESYTESDFEPIDLQTDMKLEYILAMDSEIRENAERLNQLKELLPVIESGRFNNLPEMSEKLFTLQLKSVELNENEEIISEASRDMISRYNEIITNISKTLITLETEVTELEKAAECKKEMD